MSGVKIDMPDISAISAWVKLNAPAILVWCALGLAVTLALRLLLALFKRHSPFLRALSWISLIGGVAALGGYWIITGKVPNVMDKFSLTLSGLSVTVPEQLKRVNSTGLILLIVGALMAFLSGPLSRVFGGKNGEHGDSEIIVKTIGWLLAVLGTLVTFGVL